MGAGAFEIADDVSGGVDARRESGGLHVGLEEALGGAAGRGEEGACDSFVAQMGRDGLGVFGERVHAGEKTRTEEGVWRVCGGLGGGRGRGDGSDEWEEGEETGEEDLNGKADVRMGESHDAWWRCGMIGDIGRRDIESRDMRRGTCDDECDTCWRESGCVEYERSTCLDTAHRRDGG